MGLNLKLASGLDFHTPRIEDKEEFDKIAGRAKELCNEVPFSSLFLWAEDYGMQICIHDGTIFKRYGKDKVGYGFPYGEMETEDAVNKILNYSKQNGEKLHFYGVTEEALNKLKEILPSNFLVKEEKDIWDYVYSIEDLVSLKGRKYHAKRNHISKFKKLYDYEYEEINANNINECQEIARDWFSKKGNEGNKEYLAIKKAFKFYNELGLYGGLIRVNSKAIAFTVGAKMNENTFVVNFEKVIGEAKEAYSIINNEFCKKIKEKWDNYRLINREEDLGKAGLRKAKMSYHPLFMVKKYTIFEGDLE